MGSGQPQEPNALTHPPRSDTDSDTGQPAEKRHESSAAAKALTNIWAEDESDGEVTDQSDFWRDHSPPETVVGIFVPALI